MFGNTKKKQLQVSEAIYNAINRGGDTVILVGTRAGTRVVVLGKNTVRTQVEQILIEKGFGD